MKPIDDEINSFRLSQEQELLLKSALLANSGAIEAWREWLRRVKTDELDPASERLLPLLWNNLRHHGIDPDNPLMKQARRYHRLAWGRNKMLFHELTALLKVLRQAGVPTLLLKGAALTAGVYKDYGLRPMGDMDILVPMGRTEEAIRRLCSVGWQPMSPLPETLTGEYLQIVHAHPFENAGGWQLDLHWHVLDECCLEDDDADFWRCAERIEVGGVPTAVLSQADQLLHVCVHGMQWNPNYPLHWVADAVAVLNRSKDSLDWDRLVDQARKRRLTVSLTAALEYLHALLAAPVPTSVLKRLGDLPKSRLERFEFNYKSRSYERRVLGYMPLHWCKHCRLSGDVGLGARVRGFVPFLRGYFGIKGLGQVPAFLIRLVVLRSGKLKKRKD